MRQGNEVGDNVVVLNSTTNIAKAIEFLSGVNTVHAFLDNDEAGRRTLEVLRAGHPNVIDQSKLYAAANDLNEHLQKVKNTPEFLITQKKLGSLTSPKITVKAPASAKRKGKSVR